MYTQFEDVGSSQRETMHVPTTVIKHVQPEPFVVHHVEPPIEIVKHEFVDQRRDISIQHDNQEGSIYYSQAASPESLAKEKEVK